MTTKKDMRIEVKVRNNLVLSRMDEMGIESVAELCRRLDETRTEDEPRAHQVSVGLLINMRLPARKKTGEWITPALRLATFFRCMPEDLFSEPQQYDALQKNRSHAELSFAEIQQLTARNREPITPEIAMQATQLRTAISNALRSLAPREEQVLRMRFGFESGTEMTLEEIGHAFGVSRERVRSIEVRALIKLKRTPRNKKIMETGFKGEMLDEDVLQGL